MNQLIKTAWREYNQNTPIKTKLLVLYNCVFATLLYATETWWKVDSFKYKLLQVERKALKSCLGVKSSTPNDLLYVELNRADIIATLQDRQYGFFHSLNILNRDDALVKNVMELCNNVEIIRALLTQQYYNQLSNTNKVTDIDNQKTKVLSSNNSLTQRYATLTDTKYLAVLYDSYINEDLRIIITRWRLSFTKLAIETGRYTSTPRNERLCQLCDVVEDETHAIFHCKAYIEIRQQFIELLASNPTTKDILNPADKNTAIQVGKLLKLIEKRRASLMK